MAAANVDKQSEKPEYENKLELMDNADRLCETVTKESQDVPLVPLNTPWTFWIDRSVRGITVQQYESSLTKIYTVDTVQGFWSVYNHIPEPSKLSIRYSYHLMRAQRRPVWEDEENSEGGNWTFKCKKQDTEDVWKQLLLAAIGEQLSDCISEDDDIIGISVSIRDRDDLILIWNNVASQRDDAKIIKKVKDLLPNVSFATVFYKEAAMARTYKKKPKTRKYAFCDDDKLQKDYEMIDSEASQKILCAIIGAHFFFWKIFDGAPKYLAPVLTECVEVF